MRKCTILTLLLISLGGGTSMANAQQSFFWGEAAQARPVAESVPIQKEDPTAVPEVVPAKKSSNKMRVKPKSEKMPDNDAAGPRIASPSSISPETVAAAKASMHKTPVDEVVPEKIPLNSVSVSEAVPVMTDPMSEVKAEQVWVVKRGASLRETLDDWTKQAGWQSPDWGDSFDGRDFVVGGGASYSGDYPSAIKQFFNDLPAEFKGRAVISSANKATFIDKQP